MALSINWVTKVITVPQADLGIVSAGLYELNVETFRLALKDIEDGEEGMSFPDTHRRNAPVTLAGVTYAQTFEIINGYTVTFQSTGTPYRVRVVGGNHNIGDVQNVNDVSLIIGNSAGLVAVNTGGSSGPSASGVADAVWVRGIESGLNAEQMLRIILAAVSGLTQGIGTSQEVYLARNGTTPRITADFDPQGNRSAVSVNGS